MLLEGKLPQDHSLSFLVLQNLDPVMCYWFQTDFVNFDPISWLFYVELPCPWYAKESSEGGWKRAVHTSEVISALTMTLGIPGSVCCSSVGYHGTLHHKMATTLLGITANSSSKRRGSWKKGATPARSISLSMYSFLDQEANPCLLHWSGYSYHWAIREAPFIL